MSDSEVRHRNRVRQIAPCSEESRVYCTSTWGRAVTGGASERTEGRWASLGQTLP